MPVGKTGYMFSPFTSRDTLNTTIGENTTRLKKGKPLRPLILPDADAVSKMEQHRQNALQALEPKLAQLDSVPEEILVQSPYYNPAVVADTRAQVKVLKRMELISNRVEGSKQTALSQLDSKTTKLYTIGHGGAGLDYVQDIRTRSGAQRVDAEKMADMLSTLPADYEDVRVTSCFSGDACPSHGFDKAELETSAQPKSNKKLADPFTWFAPDTEAFAQNLATQMGKHGFKDVEVTGYHGAGKTFAQVEATVHQRTNSDRSEVVRRSEVSRKFRPK